MRGAVACARGVLPLPNRHGRATPPDEGEAYDTIDAGAFGEHTCAIVRPGGGAR
eukprot:gene50362-63736_t